jgi:predicted metal-binding protein
MLLFGFLFLLLIYLCNHVAKFTPGNLLHWVQSNVLFVSWCLTPLIVAVCFICGGNQRTRRKPPTYLSQVTDKLYHIMVYTSPWSRFELTSVVIGTDCICSCKSNCHTITATTAPGRPFATLHYIYSNMQYVS